MRRYVLAVAAISLICLLIRAARVGVDGGYLDPITHVTVQDEAYFVNAATHMARHGDWLTPIFLGRYAFYKPPLLMWLSGASAWLFGVSRLALRLPVTLLGCMAACLIFFCVARLRSWQAGACAAALLISHRQWLVLSSLTMTDGLLVAFSIAAMVCLFLDPRLESRRAFVGFSVAVAAAILTKSIAGVLPFLVLPLYWVIAPRDRRPTLRRIFAAGVFAVLLAIPWFLYQLAVHTRWFWVEHIQLEILDHGAGHPPQTSQESQIWFYFRRMALFDPVLLIASLAALPWFFAGLRKRQPSALLLLCWLGLTLTAALAWNYRSASYLLPTVPALCILATLYGPVGSRRFAAWGLVLLGVAFLVKTAQPSRPWGLDFRGGTINRAAQPLDDYCERGRGNDLVIVGLADDLYATALPLPKVRYCLINTPQIAERGKMDFASMGISLSAAQFNDLSQWEPYYRRILDGWALHSAEPIGTMIYASSPQEIAGMVRAHPNTDFFAPIEFLSVLGPAAEPTHETEQVAPGYFLLLARHALPRQTPPAAGACRL